MWVVDQVGGGGGGGGGGGEATAGIRDMQRWKDSSRNLQVY